MAMKVYSLPLDNPARPPAGEVLCAADELLPGKVRRFLFVAGPDQFRGLVIRARAGVRAYVDWCGHLGLPLQDDRDDIIQQDGLLVCQWHWARFSPETGAPVDGPCVGGLPVWPIVVGQDGVVRTA